MKRLLAVICLAAGMTPPSLAQVPSCYDLWYARNYIMAENGYCFKTPMGIQTFSEFDCWTDKPKLSSAERKEVAKIQALEKKKRCKVN